MRLPQRTNETSDSRIFAEFSRSFRKFSRTFRNVRRSKRSENDSERSETAQNGANMTRNSAKMNHSCKTVRKRCNRASRNFLWITLSGFFGNFFTKFFNLCERRRRSGGWTGALRAAGLGTAARGSPPRRRRPNKLKILF